MHTLAGSTLDARLATRAGRIRTWKRLWWVGGTVLAAAVLMFGYLRIAGTTPVNSDGAGDALQAWDMLHGNVLLHGWWATDVTFLTTELPQYALVEAMAGLRPEVVHICAAMTYTMLVLLAAYAAKGRAVGVEGVGRALLAVLIMIAPEPGLGTYTALSSPDHIGTGVPLLLMMLLLDWAPRRWWVPVATGGLLACGLIGDPLVLLVGVLPVVAVCLPRAALSIHRSQATARQLWFELSLVAAAALAMAVTRLVAVLVTAAGGLKVRQLSNLSAPGGSWNAVLAVRNILNVFGADFGYEQGLFNGGSRTMPGHTQNATEIVFAAVHLVGVAAVIIAIVLAARRLIGALVRRADGSQDFVSDLIVTAVVVNVGVFFFTYPATNLFAGHEIGPALSLGAVLVGRQFGGILARTATDQANRARTVLWPAMAAALACYCGMLGYAAAQSQLPPANVALADWLVAHGMRYGLAGYWESSSVMLVSGTKISVGSVVHNGKGFVVPNPWEVDMRPFNPVAHSANFMVLDSDTLVTRKQTLRTFGTPSKIYHFQDYTIMVWSKNLLPDLKPPPADWVAAS